MARENNTGLQDKCSKMYLILNLKYIALPLSSLYICNKRILIYPKFAILYILIYPK